MAEMRSHGIVFALDDFGAEHDLAALVQDMGFEIAKIDGSLVKNVDQSVAANVGGAGRDRRRAGAGDVCGRRSGGDRGRGELAARRGRWLHAGLGPAHRIFRHGRPNFGAPTVTPCFL